MITNQGAAHAEYHRLVTASAGEALQRQVQAFADRTTRYIHIYQLSDPGSWQAAGDVEHAQILEALIAGDERGHSPGWPITWSAPRCGCSPTARPSSRRSRCRMRSR